MHLNYGTDDLQFIEALEGCGKFKLKHWRLLRDELSSFIEKKENGKTIKPIEDMYRYYSETNDISNKFATSAVLATLASPTRRSQIVTYQQGEQHLNLWTMIIGHSSIARKTTIEKKLKNLMVDTNIPRIPPKFTAAALIDVVKKYPSGMLIRAEASGWLTTFKKEHYDTLPELFCEWYDCADELTHFTRTGGEETTDEPPFGHIWTSTTPFSFELFEDKLFTQGFMFRWLYTLEMVKERYFPISPDPQTVTALTMQNIYDLINKTKDTPIEVILSTDSFTPAYTNYQNYCDTIVKEVQNVMSFVYPYYGRIPEFVIKIAAILELNRFAYLEIPLEENQISIPLTDGSIDLAVKIVRMYEQEFRDLVRYTRGIASSKPVKTDKLSQDLVLNIIRYAEHSIISNSDIIDRTGLDRNRVSLITRTLMDANKIVKTWSPTLGKRGSPPALFYVVDTEKGQKMTDAEAREMWVNDQGFGHMITELKAQNKI